MGFFGAPGRSLKKKANNNPRKLSDKLNKISKYIDHSNKSSRNNAIYALVKLAEVDPDSARALIEECESRLDDGYKKNRSCAASASNHIAKEHPQDVVEYQDKLVDMVETDSYDTAREYAAKCLGELGTETAVRTLSDAKEAEEDPEVRKEIMEALDNARENSTDVSDTGSTKTGMLTECPECSSSLKDLGGIPRSCPGCGSSIKSFL
jgi:HEAT repeat protein